MFGKSWTFNWEPTQTSSLEVHSPLLEWMKTIGIITATSADWFHATKRETRETIKQLLSAGIIMRGQAQSEDNQKLTVYAIEPVAGDEAVKKLILERVLDHWLDYVEPIDIQINPSGGTIRIGDEPVDIRILYGDVHPPERERVLWFGANWDEFRSVVQPGHFAATLDVWEKGMVMKWEHNWTPVPLSLLTKG